MPEKEVEVYAADKAKREETAIEDDNKGTAEGNPASNIHDEGWKIDILFEAKSQFQHLDRSGDSRISREELRLAIPNQLRLQSNSPETHLLENFANLSGGSGSITKTDVDRAILGTLTATLEHSPVGSRLNFEARSGITRWADSTNHRRTIDLQNEFNAALSGSGKQIRIEKMKFLNHLIEYVPATRFTLMEGNTVVDRFSSISTSNALHSLVIGQSTKGGSTIFENHIPNNKEDFEIKENLVEIRALQHLMHDPIIQKDGEITLDAMTKYQSSSQEQKYSQFFLQYNFGKLAVKTGYPASVSKEDLRKEMEESVSKLIAKSLSRSKKESDDLIDRFIKTSLQDEYLGVSGTFLNTLNAAIEKQGCSATLSPKVGDMKTVTGEHIRSLSIISKSDPQTSKVINFLTKDPSLAYKGYERTTSPFGSL
ncbi:MAG TPA: hypothetical protein EYN91_17805 [Candidatus Melainabacteria bacterium]|nr:hypothetical protein [Candidatus Melainabacteria bacterium]HIN65276.1 hypothetical protein [Candidatus Obscuribacterales bacterium]